MRVSLITFSLLAATFCSASIAQKSPVKPKTPLTGQGNADRARALIPGLGGAPPKKKPFGPPVDPKANSQTAPVGPPGSLPGFSNLQTRKLNPLLFGVQVNWGDGAGLKGWDKDEGARARRLDQLIKGSGAGVIRVDLLWSEIEPVQGKLDFARTDQFIRHLNTLAVPAIVRISNAPAWAISSEPGPAGRLFYPGVSSHPDLQKFVATCSTRYHGKFRAWQCFDQPEKAVDAKRYAELLKAFAKGVKQGDLGAKIAIGSLSTATSTYLSSLYQEGAKADFDCVAMRMVDETGAIKTNWLDQVRDLLSRNMDAAKEIWATDWGVGLTGAGGGFSPQHQAKVVRDTLAAFQERPYISLAIYRSLLDTAPADSRAVAENEGLCTENLMPRPAFYAFREMTMGTPTSSGLVFAHVPMIGAVSLLPDPEMKPSAKVMVDAGKSGAPLPRLGDMVSQSQQLSGKEAFATLAKRIKQAGIKVVRFDPFPSPDMITPLDANRPNSGTYGFNIDWRFAEQMISAIELGGAKPMIAFSTMPTRLLGDAQDSHLPRDLNEFGAMIGMIVKTIKTNHKSPPTLWELGLSAWNSPFQWLSMERAFQRAVKAEIPSAQVGGPDTRDLLWTNGLLAALKTDASAKLDFVTLRDVSVNSKQWMTWQSELKQLQLTLPEVIITGSPSFSGQDREGLGASALRLNEVATAMQSGNVKFAFDDVVDTKDLRHPTSRLNGRPGLITWDDQPKPEFNAVIALDKMSGNRLVAESDETAIQSIASRDANEVYVLVWRHTMPTPGARTVQVASLQVRALPWGGATHAQVWAIKGGLETLLPVFPDALSNIATGQNIEVPVPLEETGIALVKLSPATDGLKMETPQFNVFGGDPFMVTASIANTTPKRSRWSVNVDTSAVAPVPGSVASAGIGPKISPAQFDLASGEKRDVQFRVTLPQETPTSILPIQLMQDGKVRAGLFVRTAPPFVVKMESPRTDVLRPDALPDSLNSIAKTAVIALNRASKPMKVSVLINKTAESTLVGGGNSMRIPITLSAPSSTPGNYLVPVKTVIGSVSLAPMQAEVGVPALCQFATHTMRINGDLAKWTSAYPLPGSRAGGTGEFTAQAFTMWDANNLYIAATVVAPPGATGLNPDQMWRSDSLQVGIDIHRDAPVGQEGFRESDCTFTIGKSSRGTMVYRSNGAGLAPGPVIAARAVVITLGNRTFYEASIPWAEIGTNPVQNGIMGFSVLFNNSDSRGRRYLEWAGGMGQGAKPHDFFGLRFVKSAATAP